MSIASKVRGDRETAQQRQVCAQVRACKVQAHTCIYMAQAAGSSVCVCVEREKRQVQGGVRGRQKEQAEDRREEESYEREKAWQMGATSPYIQEVEGCIAGGEGREGEEVVVVVA